MPSAGATAADLDAVATGVAPLPLPSPLRAMWGRFQDPSVMPYPDWGTALQRLELWRQEREEAGLSPSGLFPIASYQSDLLLCADLTAPPDLGVPLWELEYVDGEARLRHRSLAAFYQAAAEAVRAGLIEWGFGRAVLADRRAWDEIAARTNQALAIDIELGVEMVDTNRPLAWPRRWQIAEGLDLERARPLGATTTIAGLLGDRVVEQPATIVGSIRGLAGGLESSRVELHDSTGEIAVWIERTTDPFRVAVNHAEVEMDVVLLPSAGRGEAASARIEEWQARLQDLALGGHLVGAQGAAGRIAALIEPGSADALAIAVRPGRLD